MASIFTRIVHGEIPSFKVAENNTFVAFLDVFPLVRGHVLVIPKKETDRFFDVEDAILQDWLVFAKPIAKAIEKAFPCQRVGISVIGLEVPHAHMHLVPLQTADDLNFTREKMKLTEEELLSDQKLILTHLVHLD